MVIGAKAIREICGRNPRDACAVFARFGDSAPFYCEVCEYATPARMKAVVNKAPVHNVDASFFPYFAP